MEVSVQRVCKIDVRVAGIDADIIQRVKLPAVEVVDENCSIVWRQRVDGVESGCCLVPHTLASKENIPLVVDTAYHSS